VRPALVLLGRRHVIAHLADIDAEVARTLALG
jgi:hypothetical protein